MKYLLDTNTCIQILNQRNSKVTQNLVKHPINQIYLCPIVKAELYYGAFKSQRQTENRALLAKFFSRFETLPFDHKSEETYGKIRTQLEKKGQLIGPNDLFIAAIVLSHPAVLVTHNVKEFSRVSGLKLVDWEI